MHIDDNDNICQYASAKCGLPVSDTCMTMCQLVHWLMIAWLLHLVHWAAVWIGLLHTGSPHAARLRVLS